MIDENQINTIKNDNVNEIRSSISDLRDHLYITNLKKDLQEFIHKMLTSMIKVF